MSKFKVGDRVKTKSDKITGTILYIDHVKLNENVFFQCDEERRFYVCSDSQLVRLRKKRKEPLRECWVVYRKLDNTIKFTFKALSEVPFCDINPLGDLEVIHMREVKE